MGKRKNKNRKADPYQKIQDLNRGYFILFSGFLCRGAGLLWPWDLFRRKIL